MKLDSQHEECLDTPIRLWTRASDWWTTSRGSSPIVATAIHDGHEVRPELTRLLAITDQERLREEDPFTEFLIRDVPNRIVFHRSRFEVDLNRNRESAIYLRPEQAWGLKVWHSAPDTEMQEKSLALHDAYYAMLRQVLIDMERTYGSFVVLDVHSYNHRRQGANQAAASADTAPEINIGTFSMDRGRWKNVLEPFMAKLAGFEFRGRKIDVRENVAFQGKGEQTRFIHDAFPETGCAIAVEFKKFFMDEWTGLADPEALVAMRAMINSALPVLEDSLRARK